MQRDFKMTDATTIEIEFPTSGPSHTQTLRAMAHLNHLEEESYRVEPLVRAHGRLEGAHSPLAAEANSFVLRIHLGTLAERSWEMLQDRVLEPLSALDVEVRQVALAW
jgi:hypothetical protein